MASLNRVARFRQRELRVGSGQSRCQSCQTWRQFRRRNGALTIADEFAAEERFVTLGNDAFGRVLVVVYTWRGSDTIRLISARKATRAERTQYEG